MGVLFGVLSTLRHLFHRNGTGRRMIDDLGEIEEFVLAQSGIVDARVSVKTNAKRERFIKIVVRPTGRYKHREQFRKLQRRISSAVAPRIEGSRNQRQIQVMRMKNPNPHAPSSDPPLP